MRFDAHRSGSPTDQWHGLATPGVMQACHSPARLAGCVIPAITSGTCSRTCPSGGATRKRLRKLVGTVHWLIRQLGTDTSIWSDDVWVVDSTPIEGPRSRDVVRGSDLAGWAQYGYCASHSRSFWGLRLHLVATCTAGLSCPP
jgi:hypothetical protein